MIYALLDTGSDCDLIDKNVIEALDMDTSEHIIEMHTVENITTKRRQIASFPIESVKENFSSEMNNVIVGEIHPAPGELAPGLRTWNYPHFKNVIFDRFDAKLAMIIGASHVHLWIPGRDIKIGRKNEPIAVKTLFGWTVLGGEGGEKTNHATSNAMSATNAEFASRFWKNMNVATRSNAILGTTTTTTNPNKRRYIGNESSERSENAPIQLAISDSIGSNDNLEIEDLITTTTTTTTTTKITISREPNLAERRDQRQ